MNVHGRDLLNDKYYLSDGVATLLRCTLVRSPSGMVIRHRIGPTYHVADETKAFIAGAYRMGGDDRCFRGTRGCGFGARWWRSGRLRSRLRCGLSSWLGSRLCGGLSSRLSSRLGRGLGSWRCSGTGRLGRMAGGVGAQFQWICCICGRKRILSTGRNMSAGMTDPAVIEPHIHSMGNILDLIAPLGSVSAGRYHGDKQQHK